MWRDRSGKRWHVERHRGRGGGRDAPTRSDGAGAEVMTQQMDAPAPFAVRLELQSMRREMVTYIQNHFADLQQETVKAVYDAVEAFDIIGAVKAQAASVIRREVDDTLRRT